MSSAAATTKPLNVEPSVPLRGWLAVIGSAIGAFMAVLDIQITNSSLRDIQGGIGASLDEGTWVSTSYLIAEIVTIPLSGWLSKVFGAKRYIVTNAILFVIFSMLCGLSRDLNGMILCRAAQGFTGGTLIPMCFSIILSTLPASKQPIGLAIFSITAVFAPSIGPAIGGFLTDNFGWQYIFYLNVIPGLVLIGMLLYALPSDKSNLSLLKQGDYFGIVTMAIGLSCFTYTLEEGQRKDWLGSDIIQRTALIAAIGLTLFVIREFMAKYPLVNLRLLFRRSFGLGSVSNVALGIALYGSGYLLPLYLGITQGYSAWQIGQVMIWSGLPQLLITPTIPKLMSKIDPRLLLIFGLSMFGTSCLMNSFMSHDYAAPQLILSMIVRAIGQPFIMVPVSALATAGIEAEQAGSASALFNMMRNLGGSVGTAMASTLLTQREQFHSERIGEHITNSEPFARHWITAASSALHHSHTTHFEAQRQALQVLSNQIKNESYIMAFNDGFLVVAGVLFTATIAAMLMKKPTGPIHVVE